MTHDLLVSSDGRLAYFFPGRTDIRYARSCADLRGRRVFVLLTSGESAQIMSQAGSSPDPLAWLQCASPRLYDVQGQQGIDATFVIGRPPATPPDPAGCGVGSYAGQLSDALFGDGLTYAAARRLRAVGYTVLSPAEMDREHGITCDTPPEQVTPSEVRAIVLRDVEAICRSDGIALLPGWIGSTGGAGELGIGRWLVSAGVEMTVQSVDEWIAQANGGQNGRDA